MKKILLVALLTAFSFTTFAQKITLGVKGGLNISTLNYSFPVTSSTGTTNMNLYPSSIKSFNAGIFADFKFGNISLQPALNFTGKGGEADIETFDNTGKPLGTVASTLTFYYLQLPVNIVYHVPVHIGNVYFGAGPYIAKGLSGTSKYPGNTANGEATTISNSINFGGDNGFKPIETGIDAIAGFKFANGFLVNINYDLGFKNTGSIAGTSIKSRVFGVSIGYSFL